MEENNSIIEEMANDLRKSEHWVFDDHDCDFELDRKKTAENLYNAGYRKQVEGEWIAKDKINGRCSIATCSNCGTEKAFSILVNIETVATLYPYCQKCGAKMKGE